MGNYLNPGNELLKKALKSEIYVDKSELIVYTNRVLGTKNAHICISRPRRFGKTMAAEMLTAYYDRTCDSRELFANLKIADDPSFEDNLNKYDILFFNAQQFLSAARRKSADFIEYWNDSVIDELMEVYSDNMGLKGQLLSEELESIYSKTKRQFVIIIDEWDCVFRENKSRTDLQEQYLDFLRDLLKDRKYVALTYMTGILPIKKYGKHSALNMFEEFSMTRPKRLAEFVGFTEAEVYGLCERYNVDFIEMKRWYDGYTLKRAPHVYNPRSVVSSILNEEFGSYWTETETYEALKVYIDMNFDGLRDAVIDMLAGGRCEVYTGSFENDMTTFKSKDDVLTLLVHLGYLAYDAEAGEVFIPNYEILGEFEVAVRSGGWEEIASLIQASSKLVDATIAGDSGTVAAALEEARMVNSSVLAYHDENSLSCAITLAYFSARKDYLLIRELPAGKGFADIVFLPLKHCSKPALVVELKWDKSAQGAVAQIKERQYAKSLESYAGEIVLVGINYNKRSKKHECVIERVEKAVSVGR